MKISTLAGALALIIMIVSAVYAVNARFYPTDAAARAHTTLKTNSEKADAKQEEFIIEVAGRLDAKIKADVVDRLDDRRWKILERYGRSHCIKVPDQRDRDVCRDAEKRMDELKRKKPARRR